MNTLRIVFCFPYHGVGGVPMLFLRLAEELGRRGVHTAIVDYRQGYMAHRYDPSLTHLIEYNDDRVIALPADAILVLQAMTPWSIFPGLRLAKETRLFFWNCHPFNLVPTLPGLRRRMQSSSSFGALMLATALRQYRSVMRRFVNALLERDALVFMDRNNVITTETYLGLKIPNPEMLAIPAQRAPEQLHAAPNLKRNGLRLAWVGRLVDFKYYPLLNALRQLDALQSVLDVPVTFDVIGGGDHEPRLRDDIKLLRNLTVKFHGEMESGILQQHLAEETDVLFAMGTSALEGARLGVPTMLLDLSYCEVPMGYQFSWLHERDGFSLADVARGSVTDDARASLQCRLMQVIETPAAVSVASQTYFRRYHQIDAIAEKLVSLVSRSRCTYGDLLSHSLVNRGLLYSAFNALRKRVSTR